jgi:hypothetical protein
VCPKTDHIRFRKVENTPQIRGIAAAAARVNQKIFCCSSLPARSAGEEGTRVPENRSHPFPESGEYARRAFRLGRAGVFERTTAFVGLVFWSFDSNPWHHRIRSQDSPWAVPVVRDLFVVPQAKPEANAGFGGLNRNPGSSRVTSS